MAGHLLMLRGGAPIPPDRLRVHLDGLARARGARPWFDRFSSHRLAGAPTLQLEVIEADPQAPTVVFMPGTNAYALLYGEFLCALADRGYTVVGFDPRGHGRSGGRRGSYTVPELVDDLARVVAWSRARFGGPLVVAGSSQGGITAFYAVAGGLPVDAVVCHNLADLADPRSVELTRAPRLSAAFSGAIRHLARWLPELPVPMSAYLDLRAEPVDGLGTAHTVLLGDPLTVPFVRLKTLASLGHTPLPIELAAFPAPVLVLQAGADAIFPTDYVEAIYRRLPEPKAMKVYPGCPHYLIVDHVSVFIDDVDAWLREVLA